MKTINNYSSIIEVVEDFSDEKQNLIYTEKHRWPDGIKCPHCWSEHVYRFKDEVRFKCKACRAHFNAKTGTMFEGTKLPLRKWYIALWLDTVGAKGISSYELARQIKVTQTTAWLMLTNIRANMVDSNQKEEKPLEGIVEVDEAWLGGKLENIHKKRKRDKHWTFNKTIVMGMLQRDGKINCKVIPDRESGTLSKKLHENLVRGTRLITDEHAGYTSMEYYYDHSKVNHAGRVFAEGDISTNGVENFWSHLKRNLKGVHHFASKKHMNSYIQASVFRFNNRTLTNKQRIELLISHSQTRIKGKDLKRAV